jgi:heterodisulfide reductase subunit A
VKRVGVFLCACGGLISQAIDLTKAQTALLDEPGVVEVLEHSSLCLPEGLEYLRETAETRGFDRVVVAACSNSVGEQAIKQTLGSGGISSTCVELVNLREECANVHGDRAQATAKAIGILRGAVARVGRASPVQTQKIKVAKAALVIGGGIAGTQCAIDIGNAGHRVYLVEKQPSIGGVMAQLDKTFPTMDCSICIEGPKLSEAGRNKNITIIPNAVVKSVQGRMGDFHVQVEVKPTYVDPVKCNGCGACIDVCPVYQPNKYDVDLKPIKAIYSPFAQAVPLKYVINKDICVECGMCMKACGLSAINLNDVPKTVELNVGAIVVATGAVPFDAKKKPQYRYSEIDDVITNMEFERVICASGPTGGLMLRKNGEHAKTVAFIQCVGSREEDGSGIEECSFYCCAGSMKEARLIVEHDPEAKVYIFYTDLRAFGKGWEGLYTRCREDGIIFIRSKPSEIRLNAETGRPVVVYEDTLSGRKAELEVDSAVLAVGIHPDEDTKELAKVLRIPVDRTGFLEEAHQKMRPLESIVDGIFLAGTCHGPRDIVESVVEGTGAASLAVSVLSKDELELPVVVAKVNTDKCTGCMKCEVACPYGAIAPENGKASVNEGMCKGCGSCASACYQAAITLQDWSRDQLLRQVSALVRES